MSNTNEFNGWKIITGQDFRKVLFVKDPDLPKIPNPDYDPECPEGPSNREELYQAKDLTGYSAKMDIREAANATSTELIRLSDGSGITIDELNGSLEIFIDSTVTDDTIYTDKAGNSVYYDLFLIPPGPADDNQQILFGQIFIQAGVTDVNN